MEVQAKSEYPITRLVIDCIHENSGLKGLYEVSFERRMFILDSIENIIQGELTAKEKRVMCDYYWCDKTQEEIGLEYGINKSAVCKTLKRARRKIGRIISYMI